MVCPILERQISPTAPGNLVPCGKEKWKWKSNLGEHKPLFSIGSCMCKIRCQLMQVLQAGWLFLEEEVTVLHSVQCFSSHMSHEECSPTAPYEGIDYRALGGGGKGAVRAKLKAGYGGFVAWTRHTRTLTLAFIGAVDSCSTPWLLVEAWAAAVTWLATGVVLALALAPADRQGDTWIRQLLGFNWTWSVS